MNSALETLWLLAAATAVTAACFTAFGRRQRRFRGWGWWVASMWLSAAGVAAAATGAPLLALPATLLLMQWPVLTLIGLRRFHARIALPGDERSDWAVLGVAWALAIGGLSVRADSPIAALLPAAGAALVPLYGAGIVFGSPGGRARPPLPWLGAAMLAVALGPLPAAWRGDEIALPLGLRAAAAGLAAIVTAFVAFTLVCERTERQLRDTHRRLRVLANIDALTQVPNRRHFNDLATRALRSDAPGSAALLIFDIDHFKRINDRHGHATGDRALRLVSTSVQELLRAHDVAGRHGGDEFVLLLRETRVRDAMGVAGRIVDQLQLQSEVAALPPLSLSFGVVQVLPEESVDDALRRADLALYEAKRQGRSRAVSAEGDEERPVFSESRRLGLMPL